MIDFSYFFLFQTHLRMEYEQLCGFCIDADVKYTMETPDYPEFLFFVTTD